MNRIYGGLKSRPYNLRELVIKEDITNTFNGEPVTSIPSGASVQIIQYTPPVDLGSDLAFSTDSAYSEVAGVLENAPALTNTHNLTITYTSSNTSVATVNENGVVTIVSHDTAFEGQTVITVIFAGNDDYNAKTISYTLSVDLPQPAPQHAYVDLSLPSGTLWATMNLGASSETDYGTYYQYGTGASTFTDTFDADRTGSYYNGQESPLSSSADSASVTWGGNWHIPTTALWNELMNNTTVMWQSNYNGSGVNGMTFTANNGNVLFIPASGIFTLVDENDDPQPNGVKYKSSSTGTDGMLWSSTLGESSEFEAGAVFFDAYSIFIGEDSRNTGATIRPVMDNI